MRLGKITIFSLMAVLMLSACGGNKGDKETFGKETNTTQAPLVIDGYTLPPDPGEAGKATLLGIDSNDNGVRDDVERAIYLTYKRPVERAYMMQASKLYSKYLENPAEAAKSEELDKIFFKNTACYGYLKYNLNIEIDNYSQSTVEFRETQFMNTLERIKAYNIFNQGKSGGSYSVPWGDDFKKEHCDFNVTQLIEQE